MSIDAYKIAIKISLIENVTRGLTAMSAHFAKANQGASELKAKLESIGKLTLAGGGLMAAGGFTLKALEHPLEKAIEYERQLATLRQQGLGDQQIAEARKFADAQHIMGQSRLDMIRHFTEAQGAFRQSGHDGSHALEAAKVMSPVLAQYESASKVLGGKHQAAAHQAMQNLNKTVEIMGGINDPKRAVEIANGVFKAVQGSGKMIDERQLKHFVAYGSSATNSIQDRVLFGGLEPIIGEFGGMQTAVGLRTAFTRMSGAMAMPPKKMQGVLKQLGIGQLDHGSVRMNDQMLGLMQKDPVAFASKLMQVYQKHGITSTLDRERANAQLLGTGGAKIYNKVMSQMPVLQESMKAFDKQQTPEKVLNSPEGKKIAALQNYQKKIEDFQLAIGQTGGVLDVAVKGVTMLNKAIERVTKFAEQHPTLTKFAVIGTMIVAALAVVSGGILLVIAGFKSLGLIFGGGMSKIWSIVSSGFGIVFGLFKSAFSIVGKVVMFGLRFFLTNPIGLAIAAIIGLGYLVYKNWDWISKTVGAMIDWISEKYKQSAEWVTKTVGEMWDWVKQKFHTFAGWFLGAWQSLFNSIIDGINKILPKAAELGRMQFADNYKSWANPGQGQSPFIAPAMPQNTTVNTTITMDGRKVAEAVTKHQAKDASKNVSAGGFDHSRGVPPVGLNYAK